MEVRVKAKQEKEDAALRVVTLLSAHCSRALSKGTRPGCHAVNSFHGKNGCPQGRGANRQPQEEED